ncbi:MAG: lysoplasmalogenase [Chitinophagaceae bacterium]
MNKNPWIIFFVIALAANISGVLLHHETVQFVSKPFIIITLAGYFITSIKGISDKLTTWVLLALLFSWLGDVLLLFESKNSLFFLLGLSAFLLAHIFYIIFFHKIRFNESIAGKWWLLLIVVVYYALLLSILSPYLGSMKIPVRIYGVVISFMFMLAMHMLFLKNKRTGLLMMIGAFLFVVSDSVLAINKFYYSFEIAGVVIMLTYGAAQFFIVEGAIKYISSRDKE